MALRPVNDLDFSLLLTGLATAERVLLRADFVDLAALVADPVAVFRAGVAFLAADAGVLAAFFTAGFATTCFFGEVLAPDGRLDLVVIVFRCDFVTACFAEAPVLAREEPVSLLVLFFLVFGIPGD